MTVVGLVIDTVLWVFIVLLFVRMIAGFVMMFATSWTPTGVVLIGLEAVFSVTDPPINAMRRIVPPLQLGTMRFDIAFTLVFIIALVLRQLNAAFLLT